jgi:tetratricopeptide (TPR) repeat protein
MVDRDKEWQRVEAYRKELDQEPGSLAFVALAETLNRLAQWDEAADVATRGLEAHPTSVAGRLALAVAEAGRDRLREALDHIKASLVHDPDNARALGLMGSLLLQRGLAQRAIPFLAQAVRLEPHEREYADLLKRAKKLSKSEPAVSLPAVRREGADASVSPWAEEGAEPTEFGSNGAEHTVFAAESPTRARELGARASEVALRRTPDAGRAAAPARRDVLRDGGRARVVADEFDGEAEPTRHLGPGESFAPDPEREVFARGEPPRMRVAELLEASERPKPKVGGSAADYSRILRDLRAEGGGVVDAEEVPEEATVDAVQVSSLDRGPRATRARPAPPPPPEPTAAGAATPLPPESDQGDPTVSASSTPASPSPEVSSRPERASKGERAPKAAPPRDVTPPVAEAPRSSVAPEAPKADGGADAAAEPRAKRERPKKHGPAEAPAAVADRPATMMVDDAIWAMYGGAKPTAAPTPAAEPARKDAEAAPARRGMVVRTDAWAGALTYWALVLVLAGGVGVTTFALASRRAGGQSTAEVSEALRGLAADLERGTLAALLTADEAVEAGLASTPELTPTLLAARAEIDARLHDEHGGGLAARDRARVSLARIGDAADGLEALAARTHLALAARRDASEGTATSTLTALARTLDAAIERHPRSPKALALRGLVAEGLGDPRGALATLLAARALAPTRRDTLLALGRLYAREGGAADAIRTLAALTEAEPSDVAALLERFLVHQATGADDEAARATARLAGLVREESPDVAKDEVGRVALAFALAALRDGDLEAARAQLALAEAAYPRSAAFRRVVARLLVALGEWERASAQVERALELEPSGAALVELLAAARLGVERARSVPPLAPGRRPRADKPNEPVALPFGRARFAPARFEPIEVTLDADALGLASVSSALAAQTGGDPVRRVDDAVALAGAELLRREGKLEAAERAVADALERGVSVDKLMASARIRADRGALAAAERQDETAVELDAKADDARLLLAELRHRQGDLVGAKAALEPLVSRDPPPVAALALLADVRQRRGDEDGARALLEQAEPLAAGDARALRALGATYHLSGAVERAARLYAEAARVDAGFGAEPKAKGDPRSGVELYYLGLVALETDERRATALLDAAVDRADAPLAARFQLGKLLVRRPRTKKQGQAELKRFVAAAKAKRGARLEGLVAEATKLAKGR